MHKDEYLYHEAVERLLVVQEIAHVVLSHPTIEAESVVREKVKEAVGLLADAYQIMAQVQLSELPEDA